MSGKDCANTYMYQEDRHGANRREPNNGHFHPDKKPRVTITSDIGIYTRRKCPTTTWLGWCRRLADLLLVRPLLLARAHIHSL